MSAVVVSNDNWTTQLSVRKIAKLSDDEAERLFMRVRWPESAGRPICPRCEALGAYRVESRRRFACKECKHHFTVTSGTIFTDRKLPLQDLLIAIAIFADAAKGISSCQLSRTLGVQQKTAFVLLHKLREALSTMLEGIILSGAVEIDAATLGGYRKVENTVRDGFVKRIYKKKYNNRRVVTVMRERGEGGRTITSVGKKESDALPTIKERVSEEAVIHADGANVWDSLWKLFDMMRIDHRYAFSANGACTNYAESFFALVRKMQTGTHHKISGQHLQSYMNELAWKQDFRAMPRDQKVLLVLSLALRAPPSIKWRGYWQAGEEIESAAINAALGSVA